MVEMYQKVLDEAIRELKRCRDIGLVGIQIGSNINTENLSEEKFTNFLKDLIEQVDNLKLESRLKDAEESLSKNMNEAQYNELLSLKDQIVASKKV